MAQVHYYKRFENLLVQKFKNGAAWVVGKIAAFFRAIFRFLTRRYTIVLVPHSEKRIHNLHTTVIAMVVIIMLIVGMGGGLVWYSAFSGYGRRGGEREPGLRDAQHSLEQLRNEVVQLSRSARSFEQVLAGTLHTLGRDPQAIGLGSTTWDRPSLFDMPGADDIKKEVDYIRQLAVYLSSIVEPVEEIGIVLDSQSAILSGIPSIWPVRGGTGHFTQVFGIIPDPFTGALHMHSGVDISTYRYGDPVVSTADGQIAYIGYEPSGFGNYIVIRHQHGFYTRYAHLSSVRGETGNQVRQGEIIGYIGSSGRSTGPHLHYEVHIGSDVVDPRKYINIRPKLGR